MGLYYYIIDLETNGIKCSWHEVNEVSIIRCEDKVQLTEFIRCEHPERSSLDALKITNKTMNDLRKGKSKSEVVDKIDLFLSKDNLKPVNRCFVGHNVSFDRRFIHALYDSVNKPFLGDLWLDTKSMVQKHLKNKDTSEFVKTASGRTQLTLHACCDIMNIKKISQAHNSRSDSQNTYFLWKKLMDDGVDYISEIKNIPHRSSSNNQAEEDNDFSLLDDLELL